MYVLSVLEQTGVSIITLLLRNTHILAHKYSYRKIHFKIHFKKNKYEILPLFYDACMF